MAATTLRFPPLLVVRGKANTSALDLGGIFTWGAAADQRRAWGDPHATRIAGSSLELFVNGHNSRSPKVLDLI